MSQSYQLYVAGISVFAISNVLVFQYMVHIYTQTYWKSLFTIKKGSNIEYTFSGSFLDGLA